MQGQCNYVRLQPVFATWSRKMTKCYICCLTVVFSKNEHPQHSCEGLSMSCTLSDLSADLARLSGQCALLHNARPTSPEWTFTCSSTRSFSKKKLHFTIVCGQMMEVHQGHGDVWRKAISTEQRPQTCHQNEIHFWPLCFYCSFLHGKFDPGCLFITFIVTSAFSSKH